MSTQSTTGRTVPAAFFLLLAAVVAYLPVLGSGFLAWDDPETVLGNPSVAGAPLSGLLTIFTDCNIDFSGTVRPGDRVETTGRIKFFRRKKLRATFEMTIDDGTVVCSGELSGMGVPR